MCPAKPWETSEECDNFSFIEKFKKDYFLELKKYIVEIGL